MDTYDGKESKTDSIGQNLANNIWNSGAETGEYVSYKQGCVATMCLGEKQIIIGNAKTMDALGKKLNLLTNSLSSKNKGEYNRVTLPAPTNTNLFSTFVLENIIDLSEFGCVKHVSTLSNTPLIADIIVFYKYRMLTANKEKK